MIHENQVATIFLSSGLPVIWETRGTRAYRVPIIAAPLVGPVIIKCRALSASDFSGHFSFITGFIINESRERESVFGEIRSKVIAVTENWKTLYFQRAMIQL